MQLRLLALFRQSVPYDCLVTTLHSPCFRATLHASRFARAQRKWSALQLAGCEAIRLLRVPHTRHTCCEEPVNHSASQS